jgi:HTH-type transcriptional regulator/antitoxin HipB
MSTKTQSTPLRLARKRKGWSQSHAAQVVGIDQASWSRVERGQQQPRIELLLAISAALDIPMDAVLHPWRDGKAVANDATAMAAA